MGCGCRLLMYFYHSRPQDRSCFLPPFSVIHIGLGKVLLSLLERLREIKPASSFNMWLANFTFSVSVSRAQFLSVVFVVFIALPLIVKCFKFQNFQVVTFGRKMALGVFNSGILLYFLIHYHGNVYY